MGERFWSRIKPYTGEDSTVDAADWMEEYELVADEADYSAKQKRKYILLVLEGTAKGWYKAAMRRYDGKLKSKLGSQSEAAGATSEGERWNTLKDEFISHFTPNSVLN